MDETTSSFPPIEPSSFDLIIIGTGLPESLLAAATSSRGKTVLHIDPNPYYGSHYASLPLTDLGSSLHNDHPTPPVSPSRVYSSVHVSSCSAELLADARKFSVDLTGPRVLLCSDTMVDLILKTGINQYLEFKSIEASFMADAAGNLGSVPDSRKAIFKDRGLSLTEKNQLMRFFKRVQGHVSRESEADLISEEDLERPFAEYLASMGLSQKLKEIILYAIAFSDYDQESLERCKKVISTREGIECLSLYHSSIGRFPNASGAMIYPIYGQGELPQAFCRRAAVKGCIYVLRMPVVSLLVDEDSGCYKGVKLVSGQELFSPQLIVAPSFMIPSPSAPHLTSSHEVVLNTKNKVARAICVTQRSVKPEVGNCLVFFPPKSLYPEQIASVRVLQLSGNVAVCPSGMYVTYLSAMCDDEVEGKKLLNAAINALFIPPISENSEGSNLDNDSTESNTKPCLLWSASYVQELHTHQSTSDSIRYTPMPDEHLHYNHLLETTQKLFQEIYPGEEFFAEETSSTDGHIYEDDDGGPEQDS